MRKWFKKSKSEPQSSMSSALVDARDFWGISPACVIDVGAAKGGWSQGCAKVWPDARYVLVEPLDESLESLGRLVSKNPKWSHVAAAAGSEAGEVLFSVTDDLDGSGIYGSGKGFQERTVPVVTLDTVCTHDGPYLLKLDTHGFEVPIFEGAKEILRSTDLVVVEAYGHKITPNSLLFHELCSYLAEQGFRPAQIVDIMKRPSDGSLWQMDIFFLKSSHPVFTDTSFH